MPRSLEGKFVTIDGPNGVGKTAIVAEVANRLGELALRTKEPTSSFNRSNEEKHGAVLAALIVEDRQLHLREEVEPAVEKGQLVLSDRYIDSSLVYRKLDGISFEETWRQNASFRIPDLSILLMASDEVLAARLSERACLSRYEREHPVSEEARIYREAHEFLPTVGFRTVTVMNEDQLDEVARKIIVLISGL